MKTLFAIREAKQQLPEEFKQKLLASCTLALGYASPQQGTRVDTFIQTVEDVDLSSFLNEIEKDYKDDRVYYYAIGLGDDEDINLDSVQPFPLLTEPVEGKEDKILLACMVVGELKEEFNKVESAEDLFSPEYRFVNSFLAPLIDELWDIASGDIKMMMSLFDKQAQKDKILAKMGDKCAILFIPYKEGAKAMITEGMTSSGKWDWGYSTDSLGYAQADLGVHVTDTSKSSLTGGSLKERAKGQQQAAPAKDKPADVGSPIKPEEQFAELLKNKEFKLVNGVPWVTPSASARSNWKAGKEWWTKHTNLERPKDQALYEGFPAEKLKADSPLKIFMNTVQKPKEAQHTAAPQVEKPAPKPAEAPASMTLFIPKNEKEAYLSMKKAGKFPSTTLEALKADIGKYEKASVQMGELFSDILLMSSEAYNRLPGHMRTCIMHEMRCNQLGLYAEEKEKITEPEKAPVAAPAAKAGSLKERALKRA